MDTVLDYVFLPALAAMSIALMWLTAVRPLDKLPTWKPSKSRFFGVPVDAPWVNNLRLGVRLQAAMLILLTAGVITTLDFDRPLLIFLLVTMALSYLIGLVRSQAALPD